MTPGTRWQLLAAAMAGTAGLAAALWIDAPGPRLRSDTPTATTTVPEGVRVAHRGQPIPAIALPLLDGGTLHLPDATGGTLTVVNFWASWCGPCIEEMPELDRFSREQAGNGTRVIGVALDHPDAVRDFLARIPVAYPIALDTPGPADSSVLLGNPRGVLPYTALISADGRLLGQKIGPFAQGELDHWAIP